MYVDCHTHLDTYESEDILGVIERALEADVSVIVCAGTTLASSKRCVELTQIHKILLAGVGIHPMNLGELLEEDTYNELKTLAQDNSRVVCISEIGLDFLPTSPPKEVQVQAFRRQIHLALEVDLPIVFHSRESHPETLQILKNEGANKVGGAFHYFEGDEKIAFEALDQGFFISLAKPLLRFPALQEVVKKLPLGFIVLETDSFPQPWKKYRRNWTEPNHIVKVAEKLAELKDMPVEEVSRITSANAKKLLRLR